MAKTYIKSLLHIISLGIHTKPVRIILACALAIFSSEIFLWLLNTNCLKPFGEVLGSLSEDWYVTAYFNSRNDEAAAKSFDESLCIVQIDDSASTRKDIANIIKRVANANPKAIGIDITFPNDNDPDNIILTNTIKEVTKKIPIVVSSYYDDINGTIQHSFFKYQIENLSTGLVNHPDFISLHSNYHGIPTFSAQVAKIAGIKISNTEDLIVNYRYKEPNVIPTFYISPENIEGRIVLIGNTKTPSDKKDLPFNVNGSNQLSGIEVIEYEINSFLGLHGKNETKEQPHQYSQPYRRLIGLGNNIILCIASLLLYLFVLSVFNQLRTKEKKWQKSLGSFCKCFLLPFGVVMIVFLCFLITDLTMKIPDITLFIISIMFVGEIYETLHDLFPEKEKTK